MTATCFGDIAMRTWARRLAFGTMLLASFSCGGGSDKPITPVTPPTPTLSLFANAAAITVSAGTSTVMTVTVARGGGFAGDVTLSAEGVPSAVTVTISPVVISAASSSSQVTIAVASSAVGATSSLTIRASGNGVVSSTIAVALTVPAPVVPAIALTAGASTLNLTAGTAGTVPLTVTRSNFRGAVALSLAGVPAGVTASFAPATLADSSTASTLTLSAASTATAVPATPVTVTASGAGVTSQTVTFTLTVTAAVVPGFSLSASPASVSVAAGQLATSTVAIARTGGFAANVTLSVEGAPPGVSAAFSPNPASGTSSAMNVNVSAAAAAGTYNLSVRGSASGQTDRTTALSLTVTPPAGITLSAPGTLSATPGNTVMLSISVGRVGNYAGDVTLAVDNLPSGVTASFEPATLSGSTPTSRLSLVVPTNATLATTTINVRASGAGVATQSSPVALTIAAAQGYALAATNVTATQGTSGSSTITITRIGGFAGTVNLSITGLPTGITGTFTPTAVTGATSSLALAIERTVPPGVYTAGIVITGTSPGLVNVTALLTLTVVPTSPPVIMIGTTKPNVTAQFLSTSFTEIYSIQNGGGGTLQPTLSPVNPTTPWLTDARVASDGNLSLTFNPAGIAPGRYATSFSVVSAEAAPVRMDVSFIKSAFQVAGMAATVVRFHRNSGENEVTVDPAPNLTARIELVRLPSGTRIPAEIQLPISPANQNWLEVSVDQGQLLLRMKKLAPSTLPRTPAGTLAGANPGAPIVIRLTTANGTAAECNSNPLINEPSCQVAVYYDADEYPRLLLRPWGIVLTPTSKTASAAIEVQPGKAENALGPRDLLRHECGNRVERPEVTDSSVRVTANFDALAEDETFQCRVWIRQLYASFAGQAPRLDSASLLVTLAKPMADAILPDAGDLNILFAAGSTAAVSKSIKLKNLGPQVIGLLQPTLLNTSPAACSAVFAAPSLDGTSLGQSQERKVSLTIGPPNQATPSVCTSTLRLTSTTAGVPVVDIPITVRRN